MGGVGVVAHEFEGEVGFDRAGKVVGAAGVHVPAAIGLLQGAEVIGDEGEIGVVFLPEDEFQEDVFGFEDGVALEFGAPVAIGLAHAYEGVLGGVDSI